MIKDTVVSGFRQPSLFDYTPDPYWFLDEVNDRTLYGVWLDYQQTEEFRQELATQLAIEAAWPSRSKAAARKYQDNYKRKHPELIRRRWRLENTKTNIKMRLRERQGGLCIYCRRTLDDTAQIDHRVAMINGGTDDMENLALVCAWCNQHKQANSESKWLKRIAYVIRKD